MEILDDLRYGYIEEAFEGFVRLWQGADADDREKLDKAIEKLVEYNLAAWQKYHAEAQLAIVEWLEALGGRWKTKHPACSAGCELDGA